MDERLIIFTVVMGILAYFFRSTGQRFRSFGQDAWERAAAQTKLEFSGGLLAGKRLRGKLRGFEVEVFEIKKGEFDHEVIAKLHGVDPGFSMAPEEGLLSQVTNDIETGDRDFDRRVRIKGDAQAALALLGHQVRRAAFRVVAKNGGEVEGQTIRVSMERIGQVQSRLDVMLGLARLLHRPSRGEIPDLLAEQALRDKSEGVRLRAFRQLVSSESLGQRASQIAPKLLSARDSALRLEAARLLLEVPGSFPKEMRRTPGQSQAAAKALDKLASGQQIDPPIRISALRALAESRHAPNALALMAEILRRPGDDGDVRRAALEGLIEAREIAALLVVQPQEAVEAELLARGLGHLDAAAQPRLLELLAHSDDAVRAAAAASLGRVGEHSSMQALRELAGTDFFKSDVQRAAADAMDKIKARSMVSHGGKISLAPLDAAEGAISLADEEEAGGEVSLAT